MEKTLFNRFFRGANKYDNALKGKQVAMLFFEPSTRTRFSFESAVNRLGGKKLAMSNAASSSTVKGESIEDTVRTIMGYADAIVIRHSDDDAVHRAAAVSDEFSEYHGVPLVPIINAGSGVAHHPTQSLLDVYTLRKLKGQIDWLELGLLGDLKYGRTTHSLVELLSLYNKIKVYGCAPKGLEMPQKYIDFMTSKGIQYTHCSSIEEIPYRVGALYSTRIQRERFNGEGYREEDYCLDAKKLSRFSSDTLVMHPLPRNSEISTDIDNDPRAIYFEQAHNGVPVRQAVLLKLIEQANESKKYFRYAKTVWQGYGSKKQTEPVKSV